MKNRRKKVLIFILILLIIIGIISGVLIYKKSTTDITFTEYSVLFEPFKIESKYIQVVIENEDIKTDENQDDNIDNSATSNGSKKKKSYLSNSSFSGNSGGSSSGNGSDYNSEPIRYTPKIRIPRTGIKYTIYDDMTTRNMERGVAILYTDNGLNQPGNTVISGHNRGNGRLFSRNDRIQIGDLIYITDETGETFEYTVTAKYITDANDATYFDRDTEGDREISLTTCTSDGSARLVIWASEI